MTHDLQFASLVLYVDDVPGVLDFYQRAFGLEPRFYDEAVGFAELGTDGTIALASHDAGELMMPGAYSHPSREDRSGIEIAFHANDVPAAFTRAVAAGAIPIAAPRATPWGQTVAYVESIEGTLVAFATPVEAHPAASGATTAA